MQRPALITAAIILLIVAGVWYFRGSDKPPVEEPIVAVAPPSRPLPVEELAPALPALDGSDDMLRRVAVMLGLAPVLAKSLEDAGVMRRFVAVVDEVASGESPGRHLPFLAPEHPFDAVYRDDGWYMDPGSYSRYDFVGEALAGIDARASVSAFRGVESLADSAYAELVGEVQRFEPRLRLALGVLLRTPVVNTPPALVDAVGRLIYHDELLEALSLPQKHLLRMGPQNVARIQAKLREILDHLAKS